MGCCAPGAVTEPQKLVGCYLSPQQRLYIRIICTSFAHLMIFDETLMRFFLFRFARCPVDVFGVLFPFAWLLHVNSEQIWLQLCASTRASDLRNLAAVCHRHSVGRPAVCVLRSPLTQAYAFGTRFIRLSCARNLSSKLSLSNFSGAV